jgi:Ca2+-binding RTX toxin-like protein
MATFNGTNLADILNGTRLADLIRGNGGGDLLRGHGANDEIRAGFGNDILEGGAGDDILFGESGSNSLFGGDGSDILVSGSGSDHMNGGTGVDAASWQDSSTGVTASLATGRAFNAFVQDTFTLVENLIGSAFNDVLSGDKDANELFGGAGNDLLMGGDGRDRLFGGSGNDALDGGSGTNALAGDAGVDTVTFTGAAFADVDLGRGSAFTSISHSSLSGVENIRATNGQDVLTGSAVANRIEGLGGADRINGGQGDDLLLGGSGADIFVFSAIEFGWFGTPGLDAGQDVIGDFGVGDRIDLRGHFEATTFADLRAGASQFGDDAVLRLGDDTIRIEDLALNKLSASMFLF